MSKPLAILYVYEEDRIKVELDREKLKAGYPDEDLYRDAETFGIFFADGIKKFFAESIRARRYEQPSQPSGKRKNWRDQLPKLLKEANHVCYLCGNPIDGFAEIDHVIPLSRGGKDEYNNLRPTHRHCNRAKRDKFVDDPEVRKLQEEGGAR